MEHPRDKGHALDARHPGGKNFPSCSFSAWRNDNGTGVLLFQNATLFNMITGGYTYKNLALCD